MGWTAGMLDSEAQLRKFLQLLEGLALDPDTSGLNGTEFFLESVGVQASEVSILCREVIDTDGDHVLSADEETRIGHVGVDA